MAVQTGGTIFISIHATRITENDDACPWRDMLADIVLGNTERIGWRFRQETLYSYPFTPHESQNTTTHVRGET